MDQGQVGQNSGKGKEMETRGYPITMDNPMFDVISFYLAPLEMFLEGLSREEAHYDPDAIGDIGLALLRGALDKFQADMDAAAEYRGMPCLRIYRHVDENLGHQGDICGLVLKAWHRKVKVMPEPEPEDAEVAA